MKPKSNQAGDVNTSGPMDRCQTPAYALEPLLPYLRPRRKIWEPAAGEGLIVDFFLAHNFPVIGTDLLTGQNFFQYQPETWDIQITNPPYSIKFDWLAHSYALEKPFALLVPVETIGAQRAQKLMKRYGVELMLLDKRINFKMPHIGWTGSAAQFPVLWLCYHLLPQPILYGHIEYQKPMTLPLFPEGL